jgi:hypothetical protein
MGFVLNEPQAYRLCTFVIECTGQVSSARDSPAYPNSLKADTAVQRLKQATTGPPYSLPSFSRSNHKVSTAKRVLKLTADVAVPVLT